MKSIIKKFDSFRSSIVFKSDRSEPEVLERLKPEQFDVKKVGMRQISVNNSPIFC